MKNLKKMMLSALLFSATTAVAEPFWVSKPLQCGTLEDIVETSKAYGEKPSVLFEGRTITQTGEFSSSKFIIATNEETNNLEFNGDLNLQLENNFNSGEKLNILYRNNLQSPWEYAFTDKSPYLLGLK